MSNFPFIMLDDRHGAEPYYRQIYESIRRAILNGEFQCGMQLPTSRLFAKQLDVSRMTIINAYEQLHAEGYIEGKIGSGTYVASILPDEMLRVDSTKSVRIKESTRSGTPTLSKHGRWLASTNVTNLRFQPDSKQYAFQNGMPAVDQFPFSIWSRLASNIFKNPPRSLLGYCDPAGYLPLREAIASHLKSTRGVDCDTSQVVIVSGSQQAIDLIARILLDRGDVAFIEEPCYPGARNVLVSSGAKVISVPVDHDGFNLSIGLKKSKNARLVYVTPSHQFPLGVTMSLSRRLALLEWAKHSGGYIIEDDYNSEFRYAGRPLASLQGLDKDARVIYVGTFSKTIFPSLRLGCVVVPRNLSNVFIAARALIDRHSPSLDQAILADFINQGHFARHIRRMRLLYEQRQDAFVAAAKRELTGLLDIKPSEAGMHLVGWLPEGVRDKDASQKATRHGIEAAPLSAYGRNTLSNRGGLVLGYTGVNERQIKEGVRRLAKALGHSKM